MAYQHGKKWVVCQRLPNGKNEKVSFESKEEAELFEAQSNVDRKLSPGKIRAKLDKDELFSDAARSYLRTSSLKPISKRNRLICLNSHILPVLGGVFLKDFSKSHLDKMLMILRGKELAESTIRLYMSLVLAILHHAESRDTLKSVPKWKKPKGASKVGRPPSVLDLKALLDIAPPHLRRVILIGAYTGIRPGPAELYSLKWDQVDLNTGLIYVNSAKRESGEIRIVPIHQELLTEMRGWVLDGHPYLIHFKGKPITCCVRKGWYALLDKAGVRRFRPYDLRHYFVTAALQSGGVLKAVSEVAGHSTPTITLSTYQHVSTALHRQAIDNLPTL